MPSSLNFMNLNKYQFNLVILLSNLGKWVLIHVGMLLKDSRETWISFISLLLAVFLVACDSFPSHLGSFGFMWIFLCKNVPIAMCTCYIILKSVSNNYVTCPNLQNNLMSLKNIMLYFMIKFVTDDQVGSRITNVLENIILINK